MEKIKISDVESQTGELLHFFYSQSCRWRSWLKMVRQLQYISSYHARTRKLKSTRC